MSDYDSIGFAILGAGMIADYYRQAIAANAENGARLVAVGHYNPARFNEISARFGVPCRTLDELLDDSEIDVICTGTPSGQHADQAIDAARAGKHVIVEKPMALSLRDADRVIAECKAAGVKLGVCLQSRVDPLFRRVYDAIQAGDLGELTLGGVTLPYYRPQAYFDQAAWRGTWALDGGGVLMNQGIHQIDLLVWYMGDPVEVKACAGTLHRNVEVEDTASATLRFANGALAAVVGTTTTAPGFPNRLEIYGTRGGIQLEGGLVRRWDLADPQNAVVERPEIAAGIAGAGSGGDPRATKPAGHIAIVGDFIRALREDRPPAVPGSEGRRSLAAVHAIYEAAGLIPSD